jgi:hypothetical protein
LPLSCSYKVRYGRQFCVTDCPASAPCGIFRYHRVERPEDVPAPDERAIDVPVLDMNHGWPNLGHDSLVHAVLDTGCDLLEPLQGTGLHIRVLSYDVRRSGILPEGPGERFSIYVGSGGPGHLDPRRNDGVAPGSQGLHEDPSWEAPAFRLFDAIRAREDAALLGLCHSFGVMCRWSGAADESLRGPAKGKSTGILENILTPEARQHPWFKRFSDELPDGRRLRVVENRLFDLLPSGHGFPAGVLPIGYETLGLGGPRGDAVTMLEFARDRGGVMPRIFAVNHHPEIVDRFRQIMILNQKKDRGEVTNEWYQERLEILTRTYPDENSDQRLHLTSDYTLLGPLRFHVYRAVRLRAEALGLRVPIHEDQVLSAVDADGVGPRAGLRSATEAF